MKIVSFNVNGLRSRLHQLEALIEKHHPDIIGVQETKVADGDFPCQAIATLGYHVSYHGQKSHYGVALLSKEPALSVVKGLPSDDENSQRRLILGTYNDPAGEEVTVINGYFPQGESRNHPQKFPAKQKFYADLLQFLKTKHKPTQSLVVMGDLNVSYRDADVGIGLDNAKRWLRNGKCSFLPEERDWLRDLMAWGLEDTYRFVYPDSQDWFSWFDYRSRGFDREPKRGLRIDAVLATGSLLERCTGAGIDYTIRAMEKPSDHCPVWATFRG